MPGFPWKCPYAELLKGERLPQLQAVLDLTWPQNTPLMNGAEVAGKYLQDFILAGTEKMET
jgi:hypothetical protein